MHLESGGFIGPYRILEQVGRGGMASVYKAYHEKLGRHIAIKIIHESMLQEEDAFRARFEREAQIVASLEHPNIVSVFEFNEHQGRPYLVMKFIEGKSLKEIMSERPLTLPEILSIMTAIAGAVAYAHQRGYLHRDIKPSNILLDEKQVPYLADFGLARIMNAADSTLSKEMVLGTPQYISPEQAQGNRPIDGRTDVYSIGVVLYEMIVGHVPFIADTPYAIIHKQIYQPVPRPSQINPEIPEGVEQVLLKALEKDPDQRYKTPVELMTALKKAVRVSGLHHLSHDRAAVAARSLVQTVDEKTALAEEAVREKISSPLQSAKQAQAYQLENGRRWMLSGLVAFVVSLAILGLLLLSVAEQIQTVIFQLNP